MSNIHCISLHNPKRHLKVVITYEFLAPLKLVTVRQSPVKHTGKIQNSFTSVTLPNNANFSLTLI